VAKESELSWSLRRHDDESTVYWTPPERSQAGGPDVPVVTLALLVVCGGLAILGLLAAVVYVTVIQ
jgi:hypothetical protein